MEGLGTIDRAGLINVIYGSTSGLSTVGDHGWAQDHPGLLGEPHEGETFGWDVAAGDFDGNGVDELAVGVRFDRLDPDGEQGGAVAVMRDAAAIFVNGFEGGLDEWSSATGATPSARDLHRY